MDLWKKTVSINRGKLDYFPGVILDSFYAGVLIIIQSSCFLSESTSVREDQCDVKRLVTPFGLFRSLFSYQLYKIEKQLDLTES